MFVWWHVERGAGVMRSRALFDSSEFNPTYTLFTFTFTFSFFLGGLSEHTGENRRKEVPTAGKPRDKDVKGNIGRMALHCHLTWKKEIPWF
jgi:hypothetical protein